MEILRTINRTARKEHKCNFCGGVIPIAEKYSHQTNVYDGDIYEWKSHLKCNEIASRLSMYDECDEGLTGEDFREHITEAYYKLKPDDEFIPEFNIRLDFVCGYYLPKK